MIESFSLEYELLQKIGEGGLCTVHKVKHRPSGKIFALKKLDNINDSTISAINNEYNFLKYFPHPGIIEVYDLVDEPGLTGILLEYLPGPTLESQCGKLEPDELKKILADILGIACFVYHNGFIYNDYKPQNFMYDINGNLKLIDFNLISSESANNHVKSGTLGYLAPEIITGGKAFPVSDLYSLGVMFYELVAGKMPFPDVSENDLIRYSTESQPKSPGSPDENLNRVILQLMSISRDDRPSTPFEVCQLLNLEAEIREMIETQVKCYLNAGDRRKSLSDYSGQTDKIMNILLKKYNIEENFVNSMDYSTAGNPEMIYEYLYNFVNIGCLEYTVDGWKANSKLEDWTIPKNVNNILKNDLESLPEKSRTLLQWLSIFQVSHTPDFLSALTSIKIESIKHQLQSLMDYGWILNESDRYRIAGSSRVEIIDSTLGSKQLIELHNMAISYITRTMPENIEQLTWHHNCAQNYTEALHYGYKSALKWYNNYDFNKAKEFIETAEEICNNISRNDDTDQMMINTYILSGDITKALADNSQAEEKYKRAESLSEKIKSVGSLAVIYKNLGDLYRLQQKVPHSLEYTEKALSHYRKINDRASQAACLNNLGLALWLSGDYDDALDNFNQALIINKELNNLTEQAKIYNNIGIIYDITGQKNKVLKMFHGALTCADEDNNLQLKAKIMGNIGFFYLCSGNPSEALEYFNDGYSLAEKTGNAEEKLNIMSNIAAAYHKTGDFIKSAEANQQALQIAETLNHKLFQTQANHHLAKDCLAMGNYKLALGALKQAKSVCADLSNNELMIDILQTEIELELNSGNIEKSRLLIEKLSKQEKLTHRQELSKEMFLYILKYYEGSKNIGKLFEAFEKKASDSDFNEIAAIAIIWQARFYIETNQFDCYKRLSPRYEKCHINNVIINFDYNLLQAEYFLKTANFNEALSLVKSIKNEANQAGCLEVMFKTYIIEASIYSRCGKTGLAERTIQKSDMLYEALANSLPENWSVESFLNMPVLKMYLPLQKRKEKTAGLKIWQVS